jgi:hypothetical protein
MSKDQLTGAVMAEHRIAFRNAGREAKTIRAAYIAPDEKHPDMLVFKDSEHRTVYMVSRDETLEVERLERGEHVGEKKTLAEIAGGYQPTSRVMDRM